MLVRSFANWSPCIRRARCTGRAEVPFVSRREVCRCAFVRCNEGAQTPDTRRKAERMEATWVTAPIRPAAHPRKPASPRNPTSTTPTNLIGSQAKHQTRCPAARTSYRSWSGLLRCFSRDYYIRRQLHRMRTRDRMHVDRLEAGKSSLYQRDSTMSASIRIDGSERLIDRSEATVCGFRYDLHTMRLSRI